MNALSRGTGLKIPHEGDETPMAGQAHGFFDRHVLPAGFRHLSGPQGVRAEVSF